MAQSTAYSGNYAHACKGNQDEADFPYTLFHLIVTAILKTITLRPKLNRFVANKLMYQRNFIIASFVVKKLFSDDGAEALALVEAKPDSRMPRRLTRLFCELMCFLDRIGKCPRGLIETDPYYTSVVLSNLGSLKLRSGYHHLTNWGTCSLFCIVGEFKNTTYVKEDGTVGVRETVDLGLTVDERLVDGYYYSKSVKLLKHLLENPELLELPMGEEVEY